MSYSLQRRAIWGGLVWALLAVLGGGIILYVIISETVVDRFDEEQTESMLQVVSILSATAADPDRIANALSNPSYNRPYSGKYWQAVNPDGHILKSRSLFDFLLEPETVAPGAQGIWEGPGPAGPVRGLTRSITLENGDVWQVTVVEELAELTDAKKRINTSLAIAFGTLGAFAVLGAALQASVSMLPLNRLREDVAKRWETGNRLIAENYPVEIVPLVQDLNNALDRNSAILERARRRAADFAHAVNTPAAIMRNELESLQKNGVDTRHSLEALQRIDDQISRSLARMRSVGKDENARDSVSVNAALGRLGRAFRKVAETRGIDLRAECDAGIEAFIDRQDLEEIIGNLLDNAIKWCRTRVLATAHFDGGNVTISIADDGPGIAEADRQLALRAGGRLDRQRPGTGLGLTIASETAEDYGGSMSLVSSAELGGLEARLTLPGRSRRKERGS